MSEVNPRGEQSCKGSKYEAFVVEHLEEWPHPCLSLRSRNTAMRCESDGQTVPQMKNWPFCSKQLPVRKMSLSKSLFDFITV